MDKVFIVGVGAGGRQSLTARAAGIVDGAELLVGGARHLAMFPESRAERVSLCEGLKPALERIEASLGRLRVVVLASGDPGLFGIASPVVERLGRERVEILPNVSSLQLAFARLGQSWEDTVFATVHGRPLEGLADMVKGARKVAIFTGGKNTPAVVARGLMDAGVEGYRVYLCEDLGGPEERVREFDLEGLARVDTSLLNVVVLIREGGDATAPIPREPSRLPPGIPEDRFAHRLGMITKAEIRVVSLAKLGLAEDSLLWDVGAGSGSVAVEAAMVARKGRVYAVERDPDQVAMIRQNLASFGVGTVEIVPAEAPQSLEDLPAPDAVFIGGSGGRLDAILELACTRLHRGGRVVVNAASLETASAAMAGLRERGFEPEATLMQLSRGKTLGALTCFEALNPVFIISSRKP
ncbi:MAG: precorrin-6y C5,15-methyltransferase (decarboxylating) subunit CbiE [Chloroflexota bacterium]